MSPSAQTACIRFDVRGFLSSLQSFEPDKHEKNFVTQQEADFEKMLDEERFRDLMSEEAADAQGTCHVEGQG